MGRDPLIPPTAEWEFPISNKIKNENSAIFIGRLDEQTGILTYTKAIEIIRKKIPNFDFLPDLSKLTFLKS